MTPAKLRRLVDTAADIWGVPAISIIGKQRNRQIMEPRAAVCLVAREIMGVSYPRIGAAVGDRDHTTVMHAIERAAEMTERDSEYRDRVAQLKAAAIAINGGMSPLDQQARAALTIQRMVGR